MSQWLPPVLGILLGATVLNLIERAVRAIIAKYRASRPEAIERRKIHNAVAEADESLAVVARARDELEEDNARLRTQMIEERQRYDKDRDYWRLRDSEREQENAAMRAELTKMEGRLREALDEVLQLKARFNAT